MKALTNLLAILMSALFLTACSGGGDSDDDGDSSGGGYSGNSSAATVDDSNKDDVSTASRVGVEKAIESEAAPGKDAGSDVPNEAVFILDQTVAAIEGTQSRSLTVESRQTVDLSSSVCNSGGSAYYETDGSSNSSYGTFTIVYDNCSYTYGGETTTVDGTASWTNNEDGSFTYVYDLTVTYGSESYTVTGTYSCDSNYNCTYEDNFTQNGVSYKISNVSVTNNGSSFDVSVRVYHEDYGYVDVVGDDLVACDNGGFQSGTITVSDSTSTDVLTVSFVSCTEMTVTFNGSSQTVAQ
ncbi:hypothetical protein [Saccharospirillum salsuginis]|nr:hypothetical protein [Saccharospirillum salsuginis]